MKKYKFEIIIFIVEAVCMILELVASRILSPYFGNTNIVWTSVIAIILLSSSIGNYLGGKIADKENQTNNLKTILLLSAIFIFFIPIIQENVILNIVKIIKDIKIGAIISTIFLFLMPSVSLGLIPPIILKLKLDSINNAGKVSGRINAIATIGGIIGTVLGGFFLIPNFGSIYILYILVIALLCIIPIIDFKLKDMLNIVIVTGIIICILMMNISSFRNYDNGDRVLSGEYGKKISIDTEYGRVLIYNAKLNNEPIRMLNIDGGFESATFLSEDKFNELVFEYTKYYDLMFKSENEINNVLLIGGAGYSYPKYFISHYDKPGMDVVEIDGKITEVAKKYFYLDKLIKDYNIEQNKRLNLITEDGRTYLNNNNKKYEAILNDAFSGETPAKTLTTLENVKLIKNSLCNNGIYLTNIISSLEGNDSRFLRAEVNTLQQVFNNVYVIPCNKIEDKERMINNMVIATDANLQLDDCYNLQLSENEIILTDDYCPVEFLTN